MTTYCTPKTKKKKKRTAAHKDQIKKKQNHNKVRACNGHYLLKKKIMNAYNIRCVICIKQGAAKKAIQLAR